MDFVSLAVLAGLCLLLASTRKYAVLITGYLLFLYPYPSAGFLVLAGIAYLYLKRRHANALRKLSDGGT